MQKTPSDGNERTNYIKGFNSGYLLSKHEPELLTKLLKGDNAHEYIKGKHAEKKQHDREKLLEQVKTATKRKDKGMTLRNLSLSAQSLKLKTRFLIPSGDSKA